MLMKWKKVYAAFVDLEKALGSIEGRLYVKY